MTSPMGQAFRPSGVHIIIIEIYTPVLRRMNRCGFLIRIAPFQGVAPFTGPEPRSKEALNDISFGIAHDKPRKVPDYC